MTDAPCPCCGYRTGLDDWDICPVCSWQNDPAQRFDPDDPSGPNGVSLRDAQRAFREVGASDRRYPRNVAERTVGFERDPAWRPLEGG